MASRHDWLGDLLASVRSATIAAEKYAERDEYVKALGALGVAAQDLKEASKALHGRATLSLKEGVR